VLDALGLPSGKITGQQNSSLTAGTTLRAGDFFKVEIEGDAGRTFKVTIDKGETLNSLVTKINSQFGSKGKASISYTSSGAALKLEVSAGVTAKLIAGTTDTVVAGNSKTGESSTTITGSSEFDALARLGITAQTLYKAADTKTTSTTTSTTSYALGLPSNLDISTSAGASVARAGLLSVLGAIQKIYQTTNTTASTATTSTSSTSKASAASTAYQTNLNANSSLALSILSA
jgi:trimeric autotransporter adhesin